ncbi:flagellin N-terminal helical domain-containing protein [Profundibacterium mesophilum]|uniref:Flagellin n=1 Tax=Profundibacterium mesophilum KAUST100406-0324 TaxID=1037889 RepID=A0A921NPQ8_9RHOB|nr:flagellin [Profundibacterium mesophilum]KAF0674642.1 flagellar hook-associated protein FlgL [Profundibacterium mesophilum KAUST100406-0324]
MSINVNTTSTLYTLLSRQRQTAEVAGKLEAASREVSTGLMSDPYKSIGIRSAEALGLRARMDRNEGLMVANTVLQSRLDLTAETLGAIRETGQEVLDLAVANRGARAGTLGAIQGLARQALEQITSQLNTGYNGAQLFAGIAVDATPVQRYGEVNAGTGRAPKDVIDEVIGGGIASAADAAAKIAEIEGIFADADPDPARNFEATFYNGAPRLDASGAPVPRLQTRIEENETLEYGVQANDQGFRDLIRGLSMLAGTDAQSIADDGAYEAWTSSAVDAMASGLADVLQSEVKLGSQQKTLDFTIRAQTDRSDLYNSQILSLEGVDTYEAATRVAQLQTQLEATYSITARLSRLSFANYMR